MKSRRLNGWWRLWIAVAGLGFGSLLLGLSFGLGSGLSTENVRAAGVFRACWEVDSFSDAEIEASAKLAGNPFNKFDPKTAVVDWSQYTPVNTPHDAQLRAIAARQESFYEVAKTCMAAKNADYSERAATNRKEFGLYLVAFGLVPPLILLGLGLLIRWIARGFSHRRIKPKASRGCKIGTFTHREHWRFSWCPACDGEDPFCKACHGKRIVAART